MTKKTRIEVGSIEDLKNRIKDTIGSNLDCAVVKDEQVPSGKFNVSKVSTEEFLKIAGEHLSNGNVAIVTAEDMNKPQSPKTNPKKRKM
jgi:hypothetical protein